MSDDEEEKKKDGDKDESKKKKKKEESESDEEDAVVLNPIDERLKKKRVVTFYDPPSLPIVDKVKKSENDINNLIRRWRVQIYDIDFTNTSGDTVSPFIQFIIGGDYRIVFK